MALCKTQEWLSPTAPHWMRLLEEKYQRLHAKIVSQAARFSHRRATNRFLREGLRKHAGGKVNTPQSGLGNDQESLAETSAGGIEACDRVEINQTITQSGYESPGSRARTARLFSRCVSKQSSDHSSNPRPQTQTGARPSRHAGGEGNTEGNACVQTKATPTSSGVVTRVSSAYPFTRLSSARDQSEPSPRIPPFLEQADRDEHFRRLHSALRDQLENDGNGIDQDDLEFDSSLGLDLTVHVDRPRPSYEDADDDVMNVGFRTDRGDVMNVGFRTDRDDLTGRGRRRRRAVTRPVKTSVSRISHKTSKSCPANLAGILKNERRHRDHSNDDDIYINTDKIARRSQKVSENDSLPAKSSVSVGSLTSEGLRAGRMRVFARMSSEARHAIDETLKEMKMEERQVITPPERAGAPSCVEEESVTRVATSADSIRNNVSPDTDQGLSAAHQRLADPHHGDIPASDVSTVSTGSQMFAANRAVGHSQDHSTSNAARHRLISMASHQRDDENNNNILGSSLDSKPLGRRLPQLGESATPVQDRFPNPHLPLPAIKRLNMMPFRETTFEITPPDFDIRFREIITCQKGDRDTPPADVRQQSIDKCEQWLVRYTPRR